MARYTAYLGLGSNLGERARTLDHAVAALCAYPRIHAVQESTRHSTAPVGEGYSAEFLNSVVRLTTEHSPDELLALTQSIEKALGRDRSRRDRTLDIDILLMFDHERAHWVVRRTEPILPHPRMHSRTFVLVPLQELLAPDQLMQALQH